MPQATVPESVRVNIPDGEVLRQIDVENPLWTFNFPDEALDGTYGDFDEEGRTRTYRCDRGSYPGSANTNMNARPYRAWIVSNLRPLRWDLLTWCSTTFSPVPKISPSLRQPEMAASAWSRCTMGYIGTEAAVASSSLPSFRLLILSCA